MRRTNKNQDLFFREALRNLQDKLDDEDTCELDSFGWSDTLLGLVLTTSWDEGAHIYRVELVGGSNSYRIGALSLTKAATYHFGSLAWVDAALAVEKLVLNGSANPMIAREFEDPAHDFAYLRLMSGVRTPSVNELEPRFRKKAEEVKLGYQGIREEADTKLLNRFER